MPTYYYIIVGLVLVLGIILGIRDEKEKYETRKRITRLENQVRFLKERGLN